MHRITQLETDLAKWKAGAIAGDVDYDVYIGREKAIKAKIKELRPRTVPAYRPDLLRPENSEERDAKGAAHNSAGTAGHQAARAWRCRHHSEVRRERQIAAVERDAVIADKLSELTTG